MHLVTRAEWGARPPKSVKNIGSSEGIFVHYAVTGTGPDEASIVRGVQNYHMDTKNWQDIAYSFLVGQSGRVYEGRGWGVAGGHTEGWNSRSHAVCWIGTDEQPTDAALAAINEVCAEHARRYGGFVKNHRDVNSTPCPGDRLAAWVNAGRPTQEIDMPLTDNEIARIAELSAQRTTAWLANPQTNPTGTVIDSAARATLSAIETGVLDPVSGLRAMVANLSPAEISAAIPGEYAKAVADLLAKRLAG